MSRFLEKPEEEYAKAYTDISIGKKPIKKFPTKCFLWLPKNTQEAPHLYLYFENYEEFEFFTKLIKKGTVEELNFRIKINELGGKLYKQVVFRHAISSDAHGRIIEENWFEGFAKYHFPKFALELFNYESEDTDSSFRFYLTESELLTSIVGTTHKYTGEIERILSSNIAITEEIESYGIEIIETEKFIGENSANTIIVKPKKKIGSLFYFYRTMFPFIELVLALSSFAERRRLNWSKCEGQINDQFVINYNTRTTFYKDTRTTRLISILQFQDYLKQTLSCIVKHEMKYITKLLKHYLSSFDYSMEAKIISWNTLFEKILKKRLQQKQDNIKAKFIQDRGINVDDIHSIKELIDIRNAIVHGDNIQFNTLIGLFDSWNILTERILLNELGWHGPSDVNRNNMKPFGL